MATFVTIGGQLGIEGRRPKRVFIDTRASTIILESFFEAHLDKYQPTWLTFGDTFITAVGAEKKGLGHSELLLDFVLAKCTSE